MGLNRSAFFLPAFASIILLANAKEPKVTPINLVQTISVPEARQIERRIRVERVLYLLDHIAAATAQMNPELSSRIEPVVLDLIGQTVAVARKNDEVGVSNSDRDLAQIEMSVSQLVNAISRTIEPEARL